MNRIFASFLVFLALAFPIDAALSPTFEIAPPRLGPAPGTRSNVKLFAGGNQFLATWTDNRDYANPRLWATRISTDGAVLDGAGFSLGRQTAPVTSPIAVVRCLTAASDGTDFVVIVASGAEVHSAVVTEDGGHVENAVTLPSAYSASLVWLGTRYALLYVPLVSAEPPIQTSPLIRCLLLDRSGMPSGAPFDVITTRSYISSVAAVLTTQSGLQIAWSDGYDGRIHTQQVPTGDLDRGTFRTIPAAYDQPLVTASPYDVAIASSGHGFLCLWLDMMNVFARELDVRGVPTGNTINLGQANHACVAFDGSSFVVATTTAANAVGMIRIHDGVADPATTLATNADPQEAAIASNGITSLFCWKSAAYPGEVMALPLASVGPGVASTIVSLGGGTPSGRGVQAVWCGDHYLVAWIEQSDLPRLFYRRFDRNGVALDSAATPLALTSSFALAAGDANSGLLAWSGTGIDAASMGADGSATAPSHVAGGYVTDPFALAWNGREYVVVWQGSATPETSSIHTYTARFSRNGAVAGDRTEVSGVQLARIEKLIPIDDGRYLLAQRRQQMCFPVCVTPTSLDVTVLNPDMTPAGAPIVLSSIDNAYTTGPFWASAPAVAKREGITLFAWASAGQPSAIVAARIAGDGTLLDPPNGFVVGEANHVTGAMATPAGWTVVAGTDAWDIAADTRAITPSAAWTFVPPDASAAAYRDAEPIALLVPDGPRPLIIYRHAADAQHDVPYYVGAFPPIRMRAVRR